MSRNNIMDIEELVKQAKKSSLNSYSPYSNFIVGASVFTRNKKIFSGSNVENSSYGLTVCAERNAIYQAVNSGETIIDCLVIYTPTNEPVTPCGACRQVLNEFSGKNTQVICVCNSKMRYEYNISELLPDAFKIKE